MVGIKAAVAHPVSEIKIESRNPIGIVVWLAAIGAVEERADFILKFGRENFVSVEKQYPVGSTEVEGDVLLLAVATEGVKAGLRAEGWAISRVRSFEPESTMMISSAQRTESRGCEAG